MASQKDHIAFEALKKQIALKLMGRADARLENQAVMDLHASTGLAIRTVKKIFGLEQAPEGYFPFMGTRDLLADFASGTNWAGWVKQYSSKIDNEPNSEEQVPQADWTLPGDIGYPNKPFKNLEWFRREDARVFFGRTREIDEQLRFLLKNDRDSWVLLYGQSGVGKSSFLNAGLVPHLEAFFATHTLRLSADMPAEKILSQISESHSAKGLPGILILDQAESVFSPGNLHAENWFHEFISGVEKFGADLTTILSFRKEFFAEVDAILTEADIGFTRFFLKPLNAEGIEDAIMGITRTEEARMKYQLEVEAAVPEIILDLVATDNQSHIAPTLQIILTRLWERATENGKWPPIFSRELLERNIQVKSHFLGDYIDETLSFAQELDPSWIETGLGLSLLEFFVSDQDTAQERTTEGILAAFPHVPDVEELCNFFRNSYLLTESIDGPDGTYRLAHDALGPLIRFRVNSSQHPGQVARRILEGRLSAFSNSQEIESIPLFDETDLKLIENGKAGMPALSPVAEQVLARSQQEVSRRKRKDRLNRSLQLALGGIALAIVLLFLWTWQENQEADRGRSLLLINEGKAQLDPVNGDLDKALEYFTEAANLGYHEDSVYRTLRDFASEYIFSFRYEEMARFTPLMAGAGADLQDRHLFFGELAFVGLLAEDFDFVSQAIQHGFPDYSKSSFTNVAACDLEGAYRDTIRQRWGDDQWTVWEGKYLPKFLPVPPPIEGKEYPQGVREAIRDTFWMTETEITVPQLIVYLNAGPRLYPSTWDGYTKWEVGELHDSLNVSVLGISSSGGKWRLEENNENLPAKVNHFVAERYAAWLCAILPSTIEWEYAAREGPRNSPYLYSGSNDLELVAHYRKPGIPPEASPVATKMANALGIYDMTGNMAEFTREDTFMLDGWRSLERGRKLKGGSYKTWYEQGALEIGFPGDQGGYGGRQVTGIRLVRYREQW